MNESGMEYGGHFDFSEANKPKEQTIDHDALARRIVMDVMKGGIANKRGDCLRLVDAAGNDMGGLAVGPLAGLIARHLREALPTSEDAATRRIAELEAAALEAFGALVGAHPANDSVQGKARARLRSVLGFDKLESQS